MVGIGEASRDGRKIPYRYIDGFKRGCEKTEKSLIRRGQKGRKEASNDGVQRVLKWVISII